MKIESEDIKKNISTNITKYREKANLSQKELATKLNTSPSRVSNWEQGNNCPSIDILFDVCRILDVSINDIYGVYPTSSFSLSYDEQDHIKKYRSLDKSGRDHVDAVISWEIEHKNDVDRLRGRLIKYSSEYLNAAHERADATAEEKAISDAIMMDDDEWK